jgi:Kef-type K+ transport system membrane component KefB
MYMIFDMTLPLLFVHSGMLLELDLFESTETIILAITGIFSLLLLGLSISAYIKTRLNKILFAAVAFALFGIQLLIESLEENIEFFDTQFISIITSAMTLGILVLFFLAIVKKK